jgi:hypothetical protein
MVNTYVLQTLFNALRSEMYVCINICLPAWKLSSSFNSNSGNKYSQRGSQTSVVTYTLIMSYGILLKLNLIKALSWVTYSTDYRINFIFLCKAGILMNQSKSEGNVFQNPPTNFIIYNNNIYIICSQIQLTIGLSVLNVGKYCIIFYCPSAVLFTSRCYTVMTRLKIYSCIVL